MFKNLFGSSQGSMRSLLKKIGLEEKEAEIYLALLSLKVARASEVAKVAKQSRSHTYLILRSLEEKGLVSELEERGVLRFVAESPEKLVSYVKDRQEEYRSLESLVQGALPMFASMSKAYVGAPRVTVLKGLEGMKRVYRDILPHEFVGIYNAQSSLDAFGGNIVTMLFGSQAELKGRDLLVQNAAAKKHVKDLVPTDSYEVRFLPKDVDFQTDTIVYGDNVTLFSYDDEKTIVRIENRKIADAFRAWFEVLWSVSKKS